MPSKTSQPEPGIRARAAHLDKLLDEALEGTFPASDPVAIDSDTLPAGPRARGSKTEKEKVP